MEFNDEIAGSALDDLAKADERSGKDLVSPNGSGVCIGMGSLIDGFPSQGVAN